VHLHHRSTSFENELRFRYDVVLECNAPEKLRASNEAEVSPPKSETQEDTARLPFRRKRLWTSWHLAHLPANNVASPVTANNTAYIIFTSGSTRDGVCFAPSTTSREYIRASTVLLFFDFVIS
jgi:acyl-CoA synthetase (AMP-forming)/AMP-acid ligase II